MINPRGFLYSGLNCGIKSNRNKDLGLIYSEKTCNAAGLFTSNSVKAHCIIDNQVTLSRSSGIRAVLVNSGNANACSGREGAEQVLELKRELGIAMGLPQNAILTASTGLIGKTLPLPSMIKSLPQLGEGLINNSTAFAESILTTDTRIKLSQFELKGARFLGIAKGSGMVHPHMGTMLAFILTDALTETHVLNLALKAANEVSFNQISIDGDPSTNDMVLALANGHSGTTLEIEELTNCLTIICQDLAQQIVKDGEGASKLMEIVVSNAEDLSKAKTVARAIASSNLVKSAIFGNDPNWGRILAAAGSAAEVDQHSLDLYIMGYKVFSYGEPQCFDEIELVKQLTENRRINIDLSLGFEGGYSAKAWGCDLSYEYVRINSEYRS